MQDCSSVNFRHGAKTLSVYVGIFWGNLLIHSSSRVKENNEDIQTTATKYYNLVKNNNNDATGQDVNSTKPNLEFLSCRPVRSEN